LPAATKPKPVIRIEDITPSKAEKYLDRNTHNRTLRMPKAEALAEAIKRGEWEFNGDAIRFDVNGTLLDGQHRLWAIVLSEKTCRSVVVENLDPDSQMTMDRPTAVRNLSDTLQLMGYKAHGRLAPALNYLWKMENGKVRERAVTPTIAQALASSRRTPRWWTRSRPRPTSASASEGRRRPSPPSTTPWPRSTPRTPTSSSRS